MAFQANRALSTIKLLGLSGLSCLSKLSRPSNLLENWDLPSLSDDLALVYQITSYKMQAGSKTQVNMIKYLGFIVMICEMYFVLQKYEASHYRAGCDVNKFHC